MSSTSPSPFLTTRGGAAPRIALLYPGDRATRDRADPIESRFAPLFTALQAAGIAAEPAVWHDDFAPEVEAQLLGGVQAVLVWCNPIEAGRRRDGLDALLRRVAAAGVLVSAHPDAVLALGTKDVLLAVRGLPFGSDVHRIDSLAQLMADLPQRLAQGARVLKQHRGHSGIGVWKVERVAGMGGAGAADGSLLLRVRHAQRGSAEETLTLAQLAERLAPYFEPAHGGHLIDQAWQPRLPEGMVRAYLVEDRVAGFGVQDIVALHPGTPGVDGGQPPEPGPRLYHGPDLPALQGLKALLEQQWVAQLRTAVGLPRAQLPLLWDADFIRGPGDGWVLCEVNVSSVSPFPPSCIQVMVEAVQRQLARDHS